VATAPKAKKTLPLVYSCSGCSNVAQLANSAALALQEQGIAQMSCIAGVGGGVKGLVQLAQSGRTVIALDGCALGCCKACLNQAGIRPDLHLVLTGNGLRKRPFTGTDPQEIKIVVEQVQDLLNGRTS
jgi:uncharacterized metal-binding protein